jgi:hypothetical protein
MDSEIERIKNRYYKLLTMDTRDARRGLEEESAGWVGTLISKIDEQERALRSLSPAQPGTP